MDSTIYHRDGTSQTLEAYRARNQVNLDPSAWSFMPFPPPGWERETPKYQVRYDVGLETYARHRHETPHSAVQHDVWQYGTRPLKAGEIIETREWPHPSFIPLNYSAKKVLDFFKTREKSRLPRSPWQGDSVRLDDGLSGPLTFNPRGAATAADEAVAASSAPPREAWRPRGLARRQ